MSVYKQARAECIRALDIIDNTQLTIFLQRDLIPRATLIQQLDAMEALPADSAIKQMRELLGDVLAHYNDPFANYISPTQHKAYSQRRSGGFVGVGLKFRARLNDYPLVIGPLQGGPLADKNIQPGDQIISVNGESVKAASSRTVSSLMSGKPDSTVDIELLRDTQTITISTVRQAVELHYARTSMLTKHIGYLKISRFGSKTHVRVKQLLQELLNQSAAAIVLDLRDNPGGSTRAARHIMSLFDDAPWVYCEQYKNGNVNQLPRAGDSITDIPLAVLVNENSMSSSEILAGALQDYKRAVLVGAPTYGKGLIQKVFALKAPINGAIRTTIAMYGTPSHRLLHGRGLVPDIYIPSAPDGLFKETGSLNISQRARDFRRGLLLNNLAEKYEQSVAHRYVQMPDEQLDRAVAELQSRL